MTLTPSDPRYWRCDMADIIHIPGRRNLTLNLDKIACGALFNGVYRLYDAEGNRLEFLDPDEYREYLSIIEKRNRPPYYMTAGDKDA